MKKSRFSRAAQQLLSSMRALVTTAATLILFASDVRGAASIAANPVRLQLPADAVSRAITVSNLDRNPVNMEARIYRWVQKGGEDQLVPAAEVLVVPPIFTIAPGDRQVLRVGWYANGPAPARESSYRVILTELVARERKQILKTALQLSLPVFVPAAEPLDRKLQWRVRHHPEDGLRVDLTNQGNTHQRVTRFELLDRAGNVLAEHGTNAYVLAGSRRQVRWHGVSAAQLRGAAWLAADINGRRVRKPLHFQ